MDLSIILGQSLKTRITLATLIIFVASLWSLSYYSSEMLRRDTERLLGDQQFSTVAMLAAHINEELASRLKALESESALFESSVQIGPAATQARIEKLPTLQALFNGGLVVLSRKELLLLTCHRQPAGSVSTLWIAIPSLRRLLMAKFRSVGWSWAKSWPARSSI
jgi:hypothetical protein